MTRIRMTRLAVAAVAALTLAACGGADDAVSPAATTAPTEPATTEAPAPATTETEPATTETEPATTETETETETETVDTEPEPAETVEDRFDVDVLIRVAGGERIGGKGVVKAKKGDRVRIEVAVDAPQELHLHGYDLTRTATPAKPARFVFEAELEGVFELESHVSEHVVASVAVEP